MPVARVFPAVARNLVSSFDASRREDNPFRAEGPETTLLAIISQCARSPGSVLQQGEDRVLHMHIDSLVNSIILQRANHFQPGAVTDVREARIFVPAEISLQDAAVRGPIENRAPRFQL